MTKTKYLDIMPLINDFEEFKKYLLTIRKILGLNLKWNEKTHVLRIGDTSVYFTDYKCAMCYLEGYKKRSESDDNRR